MDVFLELLTKFAEERIGKGKGATFALNKDFLQTEEFLKTWLEKRQIPYKKQALGCPTSKNIACWIAERPNSRFKVADAKQGLLTFIP